MFAYNETTHTHTHEHTHTHTNTHTHTHTPPGYSLPYSVPTYSI